MQPTQIERQPGRLGTLALRPAWTSAAPLLCAAHCAATPALVVVAPALADNLALELLLLGASVALSVVALGTAVGRHGRRSVWLPVALGLALWSASLMGFFEPFLPESATTIMASLTVAAGLFWNARLLATTPSGCGCPVCEEPAARPD